MSHSDVPRVALSTGSLFIWSLERVFDLASVAGYDGVEVLVDSRMESFDAGYLNSLQERSRTPIVSVHTPFAETVEGWPAAPEGRLEMTVRLAERVGAQTVVAHLPQSRPVGHVQLGLGGRIWRREFLLPWGDGTGARYHRWLKEQMPLLQAQTPVRIAIENMPARQVFGRRVPFHYCGSVPELAQFPYLVLDTTHWGTFGVDPVAVYSQLADRIVHIHLADYDGREHRVPFTGNLALGELLRAVRRHGFQGAIVVETEPWALASGDWSGKHITEVLTQVRHQVLATHDAPSHSHRPK